MASKNETTKPSELDKVDAHIKNMQHPLKTLWKL